MSSTIFIILVIVFAIVIIVFINLVGRPIPKGIDKVYYINEWNDIIELSKERKTRPLSVVNADKLLDEALKTIGFSGNNIAERLMSAKQQLKDRNSVWKAHKLRNKIVHESLHEPSDKDIKEALKGYFRALKDLRVI
jgi:hypothetical protein